MRDNSSRCRELNARGFEDMTSRIACRRPSASTGAMSTDRILNCWPAWAPTRGSFAVSSHCTNWPVRRQTPERPESGPSSTPTSGALPALAQQHMAELLPMAMAAPSAPVIRAASSAANSRAVRVSSRGTSAVRTVGLLYNARGEKKTGIAPDFCLWQAANPRQSACSPRWKFPAVYMLPSSALAEPCVVSDFERLRIGRNTASCAAIRAPTS